MAVVDRSLEGRGKMEDEAALSSSNKQEVFVSYSLTLSPWDRRVKGRGWTRLKIL
jgi:hypothetical protein